MADHKIIYSTILTRSEAEKLSVVKPEITIAVKAAAEKEFEREFSRLCQVVSEPIFVPKNIIEKSELLEGLFKKYSDKITVVEDSEAGKSSSKVIKKRNRVGSFDRSTIV